MSSTLFISTHSICKAYGTHALFSDISLGFFSNERMGLIGPNGSGKSTLLKILAGIESPDSGNVSRKRGINLVYLPQEDRFDLTKTIEETLFDSLPDIWRDSGHCQETREMLRRMEFSDTGQKVGTLSGGWRKRLAVVRALIQKPDLLLMDEPTNHLDLEGILWLESLLRQAPFAFVLVSHDRYFLEHTTNRIVELNRLYPDGFLKVDGNYSEFLQKREAFINTQAQQEAVLSNKVKRELEWLRRGPKARSTKARYRIESAHQLQDELSTVKSRNVQNKASLIDFEATNRKTKRLLEAEDIGISRGGKRLFGHLNLKLSPGMCLGVLGRNGSGKSTLMHMLKGDMAPDSGSIKEADGLRIVMFDQRREQLDQNKTLRQALCPEGDSVLFQGRSIHVASWAKRFLFPPEKLALPVSQLSGGEQARVLIANLMLKPADILLLDEPTNDLDIPTLEVLEESLEEFPGAIVLITHDRFLMDRLSDMLLYLDSKGNAEFFADYDQWLQSQTSQASPESPSRDERKLSKKIPPPKLSYEEQKELGRMDKKLEKAEETVAEINRQLHAPEIMSDAERLMELCARLKEAESKMEELYQRWYELEELSQK